MTVKHTRSSKGLITGLFLLILASACTTTKKNAATAAPATAATSTIPAAPVNTIAATVPAKPRSTDGLYPPGDEELTAIRAKHPETTLNQLNEGYILYTMGPCIKCHKAFSIYKRDEQSWKHIIDDMAMRAMMPPAQKESVYKFVLSIKATQPG